MRTFIVTLSWAFVWWLEKRECEQWKKKAQYYEVLYNRACIKLVKLSEQIERSKHDKRIKREPARGE